MKCSHLTLQLNTTVFEAANNYHVSVRDSLIFLPVFSANLELLHVQSREDGPAPAVRDEPDTLQMVVQVSGHIPRLFVICYCQMAIGIVPEDRCVSSPVASFVVNNKPNNGKRFLQALGKVFLFTISLLSFIVSNYGE